MSCVVFTVNCRVCAFWSDRHKEESVVIHIIHLGLARRCKFLQTCPPSKSRGRQYLPLTMHQKAKQNHEDKKETKKKRRRRRMEAFDRSICENNVGQCLKFIILKLYITNIVAVLMATLMSLRAWLCTLSSDYRSLLHAVEQNLKCLSFSHYKSFQKLFIRSPSHVTDFIQKSLPSFLLNFLTVVEQFFLTRLQSTLFNGRHFRNCTAN